jgi:hypothetical protein
MCLRYVSPKRTFGAVLIQLGRSIDPLDDKEVQWWWHYAGRHQTDARQCITKYAGNVMAFKKRRNAQVFALLMHGSGEDMVREVSLAQFRCATNGAGT